MTPEQLKKLAENVCPKCGKHFEKRYQKWCRQCKECILKTNREYASSRMPEHVRLKNKERKRKWIIEHAEQMKKIKAKYNKRRYAEDPKIKEHIKKRWVEKLKWERQNAPERAIARSRTNYAIKTGKIKRPDRCSECLKLCKPDAAHLNYEKPLEITWLCRQCHASMDIKEYFRIKRERYTADTPAEAICAAALAIGG